MNLITNKITKLRARIKHDLNELMKLEKALGMKETAFEFVVIK